LRSALDAYLLGMDREKFGQNAEYEVKTWLWESPVMQAQVYTNFMQKFDQVVRDPERYITASGVRYVALPSSQHPPDYLGTGWTVLQSGPYWQVWERGNPSSH
jgi:hypothetical protein